MQAACRQKEAEVRIDVVRTQKQTGPSEQNYAVRVTDQHDNPILVSDNRRMPRHWRVRDRDYHMIKNINEFSEEMDVREELLKQVDNNLT